MDFTLCERMRHIPAFFVSLYAVSITQLEQTSLIFEEFKSDLSQIMGAIFDTLSKGMKSVAQVKLQTFPRMADFARYGYAFAEVLTGDGTDFIKAYNKNMTYVKSIMIESMPLVMVVAEFMEVRKRYEGTATSLLEALTQTALQHHISTTKGFPNSPAALSQRLDAVNDDLKNAGIDFSRGKGHRSRKVILTKLVQTGQKKGSKNIKQKKIQGE